MRSLIKQFVIFIVCYFSLISAVLAKQHFIFHSKITNIPNNFQQIMQQYTWREGCPVLLNNLLYLQLSYWGFDNKPHQGTLIVNQQIASETVQIFHQLFMIKFPIAKMQPLDFYQGDDIKSMSDNNTVAFNCRALTSDPRFFSIHSYGDAIDINPVENPYVINGLLLPQQGRKYLSRNPHVKGIIVKGSKIYNIFMHYGWQWGGDWQNMKDYQHFEKDN